MTDETRCPSPRADRSCGHPNHGNSDHDCGPFLGSPFPFAFLLVVRVLFFPLRAAGWVLWHLLDMLFGIGDEAYD